MPRNVLGALCAVMMFAAVLAIVPLVTAAPVEAHNCVETYGSNAFTYGSAPSANNGHGHFCGIRRTPKPKPKPPTTTAPPTTTTPPPDTTPPIIPKCGTDEHLHSYRGSWCHTNHTAANNDCRTHRADGTHIVTPCPTKTSTPDDNGDDGTVRACQPWPNCQNNRDPKDSSSSTTPDLCRGPERRNHHDHGGTVDCHSRGHAPDGHGHAASNDPVRNAVTTAISYYLGDATPAEIAAAGLAGLPPAALAKFRAQAPSVIAATPDAVNTARQEVIKAAQKAGTWLLTEWDRLSPEEKIVVIGVTCFVGASTAVGGLACGVVLAIADIRLPRSDASSDASSGTKPSEGGTAASSPQPDSDTSGDSDSGDSDSGDSDATEAKKPPTLAEIAKAQAARVPRPQLEAMKNQWRCANGFPSFCQ